MGVNYLLDTNAFLWLFTSGRQRRPEVIEALQAPDSTVYVSAVTALEIATKHRIGKLPQAAAIVAAWQETVRTLGAAELPLASRHATLAGELDWSHRDPFDRLLVAQSVIENLTIVSADEAMLAAPDVTVLAW